MKKIDILQNIVLQTNGILTTASATSHGISRPYFLEFVRKNGFEKIRNGVYLAPDAWEDTMFVLQQRYKNIVFSHGTALFLLDMTDHEPLEYEVTIPRGYNPTVLSKNGVRAYSVKKENFELGIIQLKTHMGNMVRVYNPERTICDILRSKKSVEIQDRRKAIKEYVRRKDKNIPLLMDYAEKFNVKETIKPYLEVLL